MRSPVGIADLLEAAGTAVAALGGLVEADWTAPARSLEWSCEHTAVHVTDALSFYAAQLATGADHRVARVRPGPAEDIPQAVDAIRTSALVLAAVAAAAPAGTRAFHPAGMADVEGFLAMGTDEILVHTWDVSEALGGGFRPPAATAAKVVGRLFPWAPAGADPVEALLWCNGRIALAGHERLDDDWDWQCAPLNEWAGVRNLRSGRPTRQGPVSGS